MFRHKTTIALVLVLGLLSLAIPAAAAEGVVNVNTADVSTLELLPRVGPAVAQLIVEFRETNGAFKSKEDLLLVRGIGERTFELMEPYVAIEGESTLTEKVRVPRTQPTAGSDGGDEGGR
ncbi:MAG TPA: helix-hairpin-helix domain-containing protein [Thermoanaerobaculia bacterium]|nr:helix-hairpin-helix domain-containing protein [Thermoanaerobaculia bacterium]